MEYTWFYYYQGDASLIVYLAYLESQKVIKAEVRTNITNLIVNANYMNVGLEFTKIKTTVPTMLIDYLETLSKNYDCSLCALCNSARMCQVSDCKHGFCNKCIIGYINSQLEKQNVPIKCPCCFVPLPKKILTIANPNIMETQEKLLKKKLNAENPLQNLQCPTCKKPTTIGVNFDCFSCKLSYAYKQVLHTL